MSCKTARSWFNFFAGVVLFLFGIALGVKNFFYSPVPNTYEVVFAGQFLTAGSIGRSFERMEERIDAMESRLYTRFAEVEDKIEQAEEVIKDLAPSLHTAGSPA